MKERTAVLGRNRVKPHGRFPKGLRDLRFDVEAALRQELFEAGGVCRVAASKAVIVDLAHGASIEDERRVSGHTEVSPRQGLLSAIVIA